MKMNTGIWIGIIGGIIGLLAGLAAVIFTTGSAAWFIAPAMVLIFGGMFWMLYKLIFKPMILAARLQKIGLPGTAKILEVRDTGVTVNNNPQVKLMLEVKSNLGQIFTTQVRTIVSRLQPGLFQPGMQVPVKIDPANEKNVVIDFNASSATRSGGFSQAGIDATALKSELEQLQQQIDSLKLSGRSARAIIKNYRWLGAYVNGNNPYAELDVEVLPENSVSFSARVKGVISEQSVEKYQPGKEIYVKYDLYDSSKVAIDHS